MISAVAESRQQIFGFLSQTISLAIIPRVITAPAKEFIAEKKQKETKQDHRFTGNRPVLKLRFTSASNGVFLRSYLYGCAGVQFPRDAIRAFNDGINKNTRKQRSVNSPFIFRQIKLAFILKVCAKTRFETEAQGNSEMAYDVIAAMLVSQNSKTTSPVGVQLFSYVKTFFCSSKFAWLLDT